MLLLRFHDQSVSDTLALGDVGGEVDMRRNGQPDVGHLHLIEPRPLRIPLIIELIVTPLSVESHLPSPLPGGAGLITRAEDWSPPSRRGRLPHRRRPACPAAPGQAPTAPRASAECQVRVCVRVSECVHGC